MARFEPSAVFVCKPIFRSEGFITVRQEYAKRLREKAGNLPLCPGVYIMKNSSGKVIYVGKSRALKNRVSQYFHDNNFNSKTDAMTHNVYDFDYIICETEMEALTLENSLIKLYRPRYNILLKDDKSYPYLVATLGEEYPRLIMSRKREAGKINITVRIRVQIRFIPSSRLCAKPSGFPIARSIFRRTRAK